MVQIVTGPVSINYVDRNQLANLYRTPPFTLLMPFLARDSMRSALYAIARPSVRPSVSRVDQSKTV